MGYETVDGFSWLRIQFSGRILWIQWWFFGLCNRKWKSWAAKRLLVSRLLTVYDFLGLRRIIVVFLRSCHWSLSRAQLNPRHSFTSSVSLSSVFILVPHIRVSLHVVSYLRFSGQDFACLSFFHRFTYLLDLITQIVLDKLRISLCNFIHRRVISSRVYIFSSAFVVTQVFFISFCIYIVVKYQLEPLSYQQCYEYFLSSWCLLTVLRRPPTFMSSEN
jgi:hypothetical protein